MFEGVITSKTKGNILVKLFLNPETKSYLRELANEFGVSTNAVRIELNQLTKHKILVSEREGRNVYYAANPSHPLYPELSSMVRKITGIDNLLQSIVRRLGKLDAVYLTGDYAEGRDSGIIDVILVGTVDRGQLEDVVLKTEKYIKRKVRTLVLRREEFVQLNEKWSTRKVLKLWESPSEMTE